MCGPANDLFPTLKPSQTAHVASADPIAVTSATAREPTLERAKPIPLHLVLATKKED